MQLLPYKYPAKKKKKLLPYKLQLLPYVNQMAILWAAHMADSFCFTISSRITNLLSNTLSMDISQSKS